MLTSDLLKFSTRKGAVYPYQLKPAGEALCQDSLAAIGQCKGLELGVAKELLLDAAAAADGSPLIAKGIHKLLLDKCTMEELGEELGDQRWQWLTAATALRRAKSFDSLDEFHADLAGATGVAIATMRAQLFADLPDKRRILAVPSWPKEQLRDRYNLAQIQGLVLRAKALKITARFADLGQQRAFFRQLKFQRLVTETVSSNDQTLSLQVSGPLSIVDSANSYGLRLAVFVPWVLALPDFEVTATVTLKRSSYQLVLTPEKYRFSHNPYQLKGHVPEELKLFVDAFAELAAKAQKGKTGAKAPKAGAQKAAKAPKTKKAAKKVNKKASPKVEVSNELLVLPGGEQVSTDFIATSEAGQKLHIELFHKWHQGGLAERWQYLVDHPKTPLLIGACRSLKNKPKIKELLKSSPLKEEQIIWFSTFPSAKKVWENLASRGL